MNRFLLLVAVLAMAALDEGFAQTYWIPNSTNHYSVINNGASIHTHGYNSATGREWDNYVHSNGNQSGIDANGNRWEYNKRTGEYRNENGTVCYNSYYKGRVCY